MSGVRSLMRDVGDEPLLHERELSQFFDLRLDAVGHRVEGAPQRRELVLAADGKAHAEVARREGRTGVRRLGDRHRDRAQHDPRDRGDQQHKARTDEPQGHLHELQGLLLRGEVVGEVELVRADLGKLHLLADDDTRDRTAAGARQRDRLPPPLLAIALHRRAQPGGDQARDLTALHVLRGDRRGGSRDAEPGDEVGARLPRHRVDGVVVQRLQRHRVAFDLRGVQRALRRLGRPLHRSLHLLHARLEQVVLDRESHRDERDEDRQRRRAERDGEGAEPQRPAPGVAHALRPRAPVAPSGQGRHARRRRRHDASITPPRRRGSRHRAPS